MSRPIASFLRGYNDLLDDRRREDLYRYAAQTVGTADSDAIEAARADRLLAWADRLWEHRASRSLLDRMRMRRVHHERSTDPEPAGTYAVHAIGKVNHETHTAALALVDELIAMGSGEQTPAPDEDFAVSG